MIPLNNDNEEWKPVVGYEGLYEISSHGNVRSLDRVIRITNHKYLSKIIHIGKERKKVLDAKGYYYIIVHNSGKRKGYKIHRMVADAFIPNPFKKPHVNHIDGNPINNCLSNLEWCTPLENVRHSRYVLNRKTFVRGDIHYCAKLKEKDINNIIKLRVYEKYKLKDICKIYGISGSTICDILHNRTWKHVKRLAAKPDKFIKIVRVK